MNEDGEVLEAAFFDGPGLLAARFTYQTGGASRLAAFAVSRRPDTGPALPVGAIAGVIGVGLMVAFIAAPMLRGSSSGPSYIPSPAPPQTAPEPSYPSQPVSQPIAKDADESTAWAESLPNLGDDLAPRREDLRPWAVRTLLDVPRDLARRGRAIGWLEPRCSEEDRAANRRGAQLAAMLADVGCGAETAVILDLPGRLAVAAAAGMGQRFEPVFTSDNLPHPHGVVPSAQALAAVAYWRPRLVAARSTRRADAAPAFVLEGARLTPYRNEVDRFDNRSRARLPDAQGFKTLGITRVLYIRERRGEVAEADDLVQSFLTLAAASIEVRHLALETVDAVVASGAEQDPLASTRRQRWFWQQYGWGRPEGTLLPDADDADAAYVTAPRPTQFDPGSTATMDGGEHERESVLTALAPPPSVVVNPPPNATASSPGHSTGWSSGPRYLPVPMSFPSSSSSSSWSSWSSSSSSSSGGSWSRSTSSFGFSS